MHNLGPEIETERLTLRMFKPEDAEPLHRIWSDPVVMKYIDWRPTFEGVKMALTLQGMYWREHGFGQWAMALKDEGTFIGYAGFKQLEQTPEVELLYGIDKPYWNKGYTTEAARACLGYAFDKTALDRIVAVVNPDNIASWRVLEKVGMRREKIARYYDKDLFYYAILREEFERQ